MFRDCAYRRDVLRLCFHDVDFIPPDVDKSQIVEYQPEDADRVVEFVHKHRDGIHLILCACEAGISRSAALSAAIAVGLLSNHFQPRKGVPNRRVYLETVLAWARHA